jgi:translation elongation factor EF-Ts
VAAHFPVPIQEDVRDLLADLLGRGVAVDKVARLELEEDEPGVVAEYVTDDGSVGALCVVDGKFAVRCGAALSMVPPNVAEESVTKGELPAHLLENWKEVVNIFAKLLNNPKTPHLRLHDLHKLPGEMPIHVKALYGTPEFRRDFGVAIEGYGQGRFSLLVS